MDDYYTILTPMRYISSVSVWHWDPDSIYPDSRSGSGRSSTTATSTKKEANGEKKK